VSSNLLAAAENRQRLMELDPSMSGSAPERAELRRDLRAGPVDRFRKGLGDGLEISGLRSALQSAPDNPANWKPSPKEIFERRTSIMRAVAQAGRPEEVAKIMEALSPYMEASTGDPLMALLIPRLNNTGGEKLGIKELLEIVKLSSELRAPQQAPAPASDPAAMASAIVDAIKVGSEISSKNSPTIDPVTILQHQTEIVKNAYEGQLALAREQLKNRSLDGELDRLSKYRDIFSAPSEDPEIAKHRLQIADQQSQRAFELERERWRAEFDSKNEAAKSRAQSETIKQIVGPIRQMLETPIAKEIGKNVGRRIGVPHNPVSAANSRAVAEQMTNPPQPGWSFKCAKCHGDFKFTAEQIENIKNGSGKWACPSEGCGEIYVLQTPSGSPDIAKSKA